MDKFILLLFSFGIFLFSQQRCLGQHGHGHGHAPGKANEHMHRSSTSDMIKRLESPERDAYQQPEKVMAYIGDVTGKKILDIGAGTGYFSIRLAKAGAHVIAGDVDADFQEHIRQRIPDEGLDSQQVELRMLPYDSPALAPGEVDKVLIVNTYHHIEDRVPYFSKVRTGLAPGGELIVIDFYKKELPVGPPVDHKIAREQVLQELKQAGFSAFEQDTTLLEYQYIIRAAARER
ncbi:MAG: methyltransferase domain-containing protein [Bacteroidetes bacterium]|nr:MAG: methyltransferase domain-containing protein [Bacteroidota bacterium]